MKRTQPANKTLTGISLFSGCGGSDLGAKRAGVNIVLANDNYPPAAATYRHYRKLIASAAVDFRDSDVREIESFPSCDVVLGCYPCQSFTMGGPRLPSSDPRTLLYREFIRCLKTSQPKYFIAENVAGMKWLEDGRYLKAQLEGFQTAGKGYRVSVRLLDAKDYGVPADRKRIFMVGVRQDINAWYHFPSATHGPDSASKRPYVSQAEALAGLRRSSKSDWYNEGSEPFSWWYMSRNRKRPWHQPSFTIVANWRHVPLHPGSPRMELVASDLANGFRQTWAFGDRHDGLKFGRLTVPRRLSWRECAVLQTFPRVFEPTGTVEAKYLQIGNAVPPLLMRRIVEGIVSEQGLLDEPPTHTVGRKIHRSTSEI